MDEGEREEVRGEFVAERTIVDAAVMLEPTSATLCINRLWFGKLR